MRRTFWQKRIPTLLGILLIMLGIGVMLYLGNKKLVSISTQVNPQEQPQEVRITNIADDSFTVSYITSKKVICSLNLIQNNKVSQSILDDRDQGTSQIHNLHYLTLRNLSPNTSYFFTITSGQNVYNDNGENFKVTTGPRLELNPSTQKPLIGKVTNSKGARPDEAIIYLTTNNAQTISLLVGSDGSLLIPLNSLRNSDNTSYYNFTSNTLLQILVLSSDGRSNVIATINQINPMPTIILSKDYDFSKTQNNNASPSASMGPTPAPTATPSAIIPEILFPQKDQLTNQQPVFSGTALPHQEVEIAINSEQEIQTQVLSDSTGNWSYTPNSPIQPGNHTISITTTGTSGTTQTISQSFIVYAQPTSQQDITPTITSLPSSTSISTLTPTPTLITSAISSATPTISPALSKGGNPIIITAGILGLVITIAGALIFLFIRGRDSSL